MNDGGDYGRYRTWLQLYEYGRYVRGALAVASRVLELVCFGSSKLQFMCVDPLNHFLLLGKGESIQSALAQALAFLALDTPSTFV